MMATMKSALKLFWILCLWLTATAMAVAVPILAVPIVGTAAHLTFVVLAQRWI